MKQEDLQMFEIFFNEIQKEERDLNTKKQYQINVKEFISNTIEIIKNKATQEQIAQYKSTLTRAEVTIDKIGETIEIIILTEETLQNIKVNLENTLKDQHEIFEGQVDFIKNEIEEYSKNKEKIENLENSNKLGFIIKELNYISKSIDDEKKENVIANKEIEINLNKPLEEQIINKLKPYTEIEETEEIEDITENSLEYYKIEEKIDRQLQEIDNQAKLENLEKVENIEKTETKENLQEINEAKEVEDINQENEENDSTNVLIISEKEQKVYLPYTKSDIEKYMRTNKFESKEQVIKRVFTVPLSKYSNFTIARVTEGFKLMRKRENAPFGKSLKYALNLIFERKLHPAIITACKTQDDLDIYLACLEDNMLQLFDAFEIRFDYAPLKVKANKKLEFEV